MIALRRVGGGRGERPWRRRRAAAEAGRLLLERRCSGVRAGGRVRARLSGRRSPPPMVSARSRGAWLNVLRAGRGIACPSSGCLIALNALVRRGESLRARRAMRRSGRFTLAPKLSGFLEVPIRCRSGLDVLASGELLRWSLDGSFGRLAAWTYRVCSGTLPIRCGSFSRWFGPPRFQGGGRRRRRLGPAAGAALGGTGSFCCITWSAREGALPGGC
jgi:hypothetical protein